MSSEIFTLRCAMADEIPLLTRLSKEAFASSAGMRKASVFKRFDSMLIAAPIQGFTDRFWRKAHAAVIGGMAEYVMPFMRLENGEFRKKDLADLPVDEPLTVPQILVRTPEEVQQFADFLISRGFSKIDLNFGCPHEPVTRRGYGAGMLNSPKVLEAVLRAASKYPKVAFSVKMRLPDAPEILPVLNDFPLRHVVLHPRTAAMHYSGTPDREAFESFARACVHKVIYNGDVFTPEDAKEEDVMLGRGLLRDPLLGRKIRGETPPQALLAEFHSRYVENCMVLEQPLQKVKTLWEYFLPDTPKNRRKKMLKSRTLEEYSDYARLLFEALT